MESLRLYPIKIALVSKMFAANESFASSLRELTSEILPKNNPRKTKLSQLVRLWNSPSKAPDSNNNSPSQDDIDRMLHGLEIAPERRPQAWQIFECWVRGISYSNWITEVSKEQLNKLESHGIKLGIPAEYVLSKLFITKLEIPLSEYPELQNGYVNYQFIEGFYLAWKEIMPSISANISAAETQILTDLLVFFRNVLNYADEPELLIFYS